MTIPSAFPLHDGTPVTQTWTPTAVWLANAIAPVVAPPVPVEVPAYLVNAEPSITRSYAALNGRSHLFGVTVVPPGTVFDRRAVEVGYEQVISHAIHRTTEVNNFMQVYRIPDYRAEGITVTHTSALINGVPLEYFQYVPRSARRVQVPLVLVFHGGGNHAEYQMWATRWPELAAQQGFITVAVNRHVERTPADIVALLDQLLVQNPNIDPKRVYATGFSMGSVKSWALGEEFPGRFAAIAPMSGSFAPVASTAAGLLPTIYFAGDSSPLPESPHQKYVEFRPSGRPNDIDTRLRSLLARNDVTPDYVYDATKDEQWGIAPTSRFTVRDILFPDVSVTVSNYASRTGKINTALAEVHHGSHEPLPIEAEIAWNFMSRFRAG